jgi:hypothetical protein
MCRMKSSDGMSSNVGICVVSFVTVGNKAALQVFSRLQEGTERLSLFDPSIIFEPVVIVAAVAVTSMLNIKFFMIVEKNANII